MTNKDEVLKEKSFLLRQNGAVPHSGSGGVSRDKSLVKKSLERHQLTEKVCYKNVRYI